MSEQFKNFILRRINVAQQLCCGKCNGTYDEAMIILCSVISAFASALWPGEGIDKKRFVELLIRFIDPVYDMGRISLPLMHRTFSAQGSNSQAQALERSFPVLANWRSEVLKGDAIDQPEAAVCNALPGVSLRCIREYSYANLFYKQVRCSYVHEYKVGSLATSFKSTSTHGTVSYTNRLGRESKQLTRFIHFDLPWVVKVVLLLTDRTEPIIDRDQTLPTPEVWWIEADQNGE